MPMKLTFLGTGAAWGHPVAAKHPCQACDYAKREGGRDSRTRSALLLQVQDRNILIDAGADIRAQLLREKIEQIDAIFITHAHADHIHGLDDMTPYKDVLGKPIPTYASVSAWRTIKQRFGYLVGGTLAKNVLLRREHPSWSPFSLLPGVEVATFDVYHGPAKYGSAGAMGFIIESGGKKLVYTGDIFKFGRRLDREFIPRELEGADVLVLEANWFNEPAKQPGNPHMSFQRALGYLRALNPRMAFLTHISHEDWTKKPKAPLAFLPPLNHEQWQRAVEEEITKEGLSFTVTVAYDGLSVAI